MVVVDGNAAAVSVVVNHPCHGRGGEGGRRRRDACRGRGHLEETRAGRAVLAVVGVVIAVGVGVAPLLWHGG